jgi:RNA polymerase sigma factor for flagellar operon FliA
MTNATERLVMQHAMLVNRIAHHFMTRLPASVQVDDLIQVGLVGLIDAAENFDDTQGAQFETYAAQRIRGAILDELRHADRLPRSVRRNLRLIEAANRKLEQILGRQPSEQELANELELPLDHYQRQLADARGAQLLYYEDFQEHDEAHFLEGYSDTDQRTPLGVLEDLRFRNDLIEAIDNLPERERLIMGLYYERDLNLKEIGTALGVSESRVCQLHSQAVARLRGRLRDWLGEA